MRPARAREFPPLTKEMRLALQGEWDRLKKEGNCMLPFSFSRFVSDPFAGLHALMFHLHVFVKNGIRYVLRI